MIIDVTFYKESGKMYTHGTVDFDERFIFSHDIQQRIYRAQKIVNNPGQFYMTCTNTEATAPFINSLFKSLQETNK